MYSSFVLSKVYMHGRKVSIQIFMTSLCFSFTFESVLVYMLRKGAVLCRAEISVGVSYVIN